MRRYLRSGWLWGTISGVRRLFDWIIHCFTAIELGVRSECTRRYAQQMLFRFVFSPRVHQHVFSPLWQNAFTPDQSDDLMPVYLPRPANVRSRGGRAVVGCMLADDDQKVGCWLRSTAWASLSSPRQLGHENAFLTE